MRKVFFSFDWDDVWQVNQVRKSWVSKGNYTNAGFVDSANIEQFKRASDSQIKAWINEQLHGTSVTCVLIGNQTCRSRWVKYEIEKSIEKQNGLLGVYIHNVKDQNRNLGRKGEDPFTVQFGWVSNTGVLTYPCSSYYDWVNDNGYQNLGNWIEKAAQQAGQ